MAIYHFEAKVITRGVGRSVVAAAAYASCSEIYNDYDGVNHDYTKKSGLVHSEILLPLNAPAEWQDRAELWNAVEATEKSKNSQLARELIVALPIELQSDEWIEMLRNFITENCVDKGMCADFNIHDTDGHNPHAHILLTMRPLDEKGKWQAKTQKEYVCKLGDEERGFTADEFKAAQADGWEKQYQYKVGKKKMYMPPSEAEQYGYERVSKNPKSTRYGRQNPICAEWNSDKQILRWRKAWEDVTNLALEQKNIEAHVDCRSFKERGIDEQPTIHEGVTARIIEKRGDISDKCETNRQIRRDNALLREIKEEIKKLAELVTNTVSNIASKLESLRNKLIFGAYELKHNENQITKISEDNTVIDVTLRQYKSFVKRMDDKTDKQNKLKMLRKQLSPIHFLRHNELTQQIEKLEREITELKGLKSAYLDRMGCKSEKDIPKYEALHTRNDDMLKNIFARNATLIKRKKTDISEFKEVSSGIANKDVNAIHDERYNLRNEYVRKLSRQLHKKYGRGYDYDIFKYVEQDVNCELGEKPLSVIRKLQLNQHHTAEQDWRSNRGNHGLEL